MKRIFKILLVSLIVLSIAGCKKKPQDEPVKPKDPVKVTITLNKEEINSDETLIIEISEADYDFDKNPWVGIVKGDKNYEKEDDADADDIWYSYLTKEDHLKFEVGIEEYETGVYQVVVCDGDGEGALVAGSRKFEVNHIEEKNDEPENGEYNEEYFAGRYGEVAKYPFYIAVNGEEIKYYDIKSGPLSNWAFTTMNTDGWYWYNGYLISKDNKYAVGPEFEAFSSFCTYVSKEYDGEVLDQQQQKENVDGALYCVNPYLPLRFYGINLVGDRAENQDDNERTHNVIDNRINFVSGESLEVHSNCDYDSDIEDERYVLYVFPSEMRVHENILLSEELKQQALISEKMCHVENTNIVFKTVIFDVEETGRYDLVFTLDDFVAYYITIEISKE